MRKVAGDQIEIINLPRPLSGSRVLSLSVLCVCVCVCVCLFVCLALCPRNPPLELEGSGSVNSPRETPGRTVGEDDVTPMVSLGCCVKPGKTNLNFLTWVDSLIQGPGRSRSDLTVEASAPQCTTRGQWQDKGQCTCHAQREMKRVPRAERCRAVQDRTG